jgi:hypothetical protein
VHACRISRRANRATAPNGRFVQRILNCSRKSRVRIKTSRAGKSLQPAARTVSAAQANRHLLASPILLQASGQKLTSILHIVRSQKLGQCGDQELSRIGRSDLCVRDGRSTKIKRCAAVG